jgi:hypothetical protein
VSEWFQGLSSASSSLSSDARARCGVLLLGYSMYIKVTHQSRVSMQQLLGADVLLIDEG